MMQFSTEKADLVAGEPLYCSFDYIFCITVLLKDLTIKVPHGLSRRKDPQHDRSSVVCFSVYSSNESPVSIDQSQHVYVCDSRIEIPFFYSKCLTNY